MNGDKSNVNDETRDDNGTDGEKSPQRKNSDSSGSGSSSGI